MMFNMHPWRCRQGDGDKCRLRFWPESQSPAKGLIYTGFHLTWLSTGEQTSLDSESLKCLCFAKLRIFLHTSKKLILFFRYFRSTSYIYWFIAIYTYSFSLLLRTIHISLQTDKTIAYDKRQTDRSFRHVLQPGLYLHRLRHDCRPPHWYWV